MLSSLLCSLAFSVLLLLLLPITQSATTGSGCSRCGLKIECWPGEDGAEDGLIEYEELDTLEGCVRAQITCAAPNHATVNLLKLGQVGG